jgi:predicted nucleotide-binding protein (sugar kinase/HSP70/actin superfamily)
VTILFGGASERHDTLIGAALEGLGYRAARIPTPSKADYQAGREYGNNGQCNPTYFTCGALVNRLKRLRDEQGLAVDNIRDRYVFATAGSCGPCRFGMYESEYRLALRNAGFEGFRVQILQQSPEVLGDAGDAGLELSVDLILALVEALFVGDLLNEVAYHVRPYEVVPGRTDQALERCVALASQRFRERRYDGARPSALARLLARLTPVPSAQDAQKVLDELTGDHFTSVLRECARLIDGEVEVDYTRAKPVVKVTGEFWAQTTEGDGNFKMFPFLESEGAEVLVEPIATWLSYTLAQEALRARDRRGLGEDGTLPRRWQLGRRLAAEAAYRRRAGLLALGQWILRRAYDRMRLALGGTAHALASQLELTRLGHPYYNSRATGGEGHLEVAKNIYYANKDLAHMVLSLQPFGCMPSTQSDGAQAAVLAHYPDMIFLPIETSGEGDVNAYSRVQMALGEAKARCKGEFQRVLARSGRSLDQIRAYVAARRELRRPLQRIPHYPGVIGRAANFALHVAEHMQAEGAR